MIYCSFMRQPHRALSQLALLCLTALAAPVAGQAPPDQPPFTETIEVREAEVRFDMSSLPPFQSMGKKGREDFAVFEDGVERPLTQFVASEPGDWSYVLYFDSTLASPETRAEAAAALAKQAGRLVAGGRAEIVVADPLPHSRLVTGLADALAASLEELASTSRRERPSTALPPLRALEARLAQIDRLTVELAARAGGGARALLLPVDGWPLDAASAEKLSRGKRRDTAAEAPTLPALPTLEGATRALAGYGWVTYPLALSPKQVEKPARERHVQVAIGGAGDERVSAPILNLPGGAPSNAAEDRQMEAHLEIGLIPLARLARGTSGALVADPEKLAEELAQLGRRQRLAYRSPEPRPGTLLPIEVRWTGGDGRPLQAPGWVRASTPPEVAAARLRGLLRGDAATTNGITVAATRDATGAAWRLSGCLPADSAGHAVRVSFARLEQGEATVRVGESQLLKPSERGLCADLELASGSAGSRLAVVVEDLATESWTGWVSPAT